MLQILLLSICLNLFFCSKPKSIKVHQVKGWGLTNEWPMEVQQIINAQDPITAHEEISNKRKINKIVNLLEKKKNIDSIEVFDVRFVAIFSCFNNSDTLIIDERGYCQFREKKFMLDKQLAIDLHVRSVKFNPDYKIKGHFKANGDFDDWK